MTAYGFPIGGDSLATTRGIVSRVEFAPFNGGGVGLLVQVDAAINPGNSGGPALVDGKMVGLVFGRDEEAEGTGFIIPNQEIDGFLDDVADGRYDGKWLPEKLHIQPLENDSLRRKIGLDRAVRGLFVRDPGPLLTSDPLRPGGILTRVGDRDIDNQGYIAAEGGLRLPFPAAFESLAKDGSVPATVLREGKPNVPCRIGVTRTNDRLIRDFEGQYPSYFVVGPLVFSPLMGQSIMMYIRMNPMMAHEDSPRVLRRADKRRTPDEELVVVTHPLLRHKVAKGYREPLGQVLDEVNGAKIRSLKHLVEVIRDAQDDFLSFRFAEKDAEILVFHRKDLLKATEAVMSENGIARPGSDDVMAVWEKKARSPREGRRPAQVIGLLRTFSGTAVDRVSGMHATKELTGAGESVRLATSRLDRRAAWPPRPGSSRNPPAPSHLAGRSRPPRMVMAVQPRVRFIGSRELHRDLPKVLESLEDPSARCVLTIHNRPKAVLIGADAFLRLLRTATPADRLLALQLGALVQGHEGAGADADEDVLEPDGELVGAGA